MVFHKSSELQNSPQEILRSIVRQHPIELEAPIETLSKPLILEVACPGWQPRMWPPKDAYGSHVPAHYEEGGVRYPPVPCTIEGQISELVQAVDAGCQGIHVHPRDPQDCIATLDMDIFRSLFDGFFAQRDAITLQHTWEKHKDGTLDYMSHTQLMLEQAGGNRWCQGAVVLWPPNNSYPPNYVKSVQEGARFMEENNIRLIHKLRSQYHVRELHRVLIESGVVKKEPHVLVHDMGHPFGWPLDQDPWMPVDMITNLVQTKQRIPNCLLGVYSGGRNWLPITMTAILAGVDIVRVGIEDIYWMYPHKNEVVQSNMAAVAKIIDFAKSVGRPLATVQQAREILGITRTS